MAGIGSSEDDAARLEALSAYRVLDTPAEGGFDDVVTLATQLCDTPVALVSLVDRHRQWFKARVGFEPCETDLDSSVCRHALGRADVLEIEDLTRDPRTRANPLVTGAPHLRFYAGAPLNTADGHTLGTLCVIDHVPRPGGLNAAQRAGLKALANQVLAQLDLRRALAERDAVLAEQEVAQKVALAEAARLEAMIATQQAVASASADLSVVFQAIVDGALRVIDAADGAVVELRQGDELVYDAASGSSSGHPGHRVPLSRTLSGRAVLTERPILCSDTEADPGIDHGLTRFLGIRAMIVVPVTRRGEPIGALKVQSRRPNAFAPRDVVMTQMLAGLVASAIGDVAEVRSSRALHAAEVRYRQTFESVTEFGVIVMDRVGTITEWNTGAERIFGWSAAEMRGSDVSRFFTPEDRDIGRVETEMVQSLREGAAVDERWHLRRDGSRFFASGNMMPLRGDDGEHLGFIKIVRDRTEQHRLGRELEEKRNELVASEERQRLAIDVGEVGVWEFDLRTGELLLDARMRAMNGVSGHDLDAAGAFAAVHPADRERLDAALQRLALGEDETLSIQYRVIGIEDAVVRTVQVHGLATRGPDGEATRLLGAARDVSDRAAADERRRFLNEELSHRLKNILAMTQSIVTQTLRTAPDVASARKTLSDRVLALSKAHDVLMTGQREAASVREIVRSAASLHDPEHRIRLHGPDLSMGPKAALTLALIVHELGTNAVKYGALSAEDGHVDVKWSSRSDDGGQTVFDFSWTEANGPPVTPPERKSFGTRLIEMGLSGAAGGRSELDYAPDGLRCRISASLAEMQAGMDADP